MRAGVGTRTVFRHFDDMESLFGEMQARLAREVGSLDEIFDPQQMRPQLIAQLEAALATDGD